MAESSVYRVRFFSLPKHTNLIFHHLLNIIREIRLDLTDLENNPNGKKAPFTFSIPKSFTIYLHPEDYRQIYQNGEHKNISSFQDQYRNFLNTEDGKHYNNQYNQEIEIKFAVDLIRGIPKNNFYITWDDLPPKHGKTVATLDIQIKNKSFQKLELYDKPPISLGTSDTCTYRLDKILSEDDYQEIQNRVIDLLFVWQNNAVWVLNRNKDKQPVEIDHKKIYCNDSAHRFKDHSYIQLSPGINLVYSLINTLDIQQKSEIPQRIVAKTKNSTNQLLVPINSDSLIFSGFVFTKAMFLNKENKLYFESKSNDLPSINPVTKDTQSIIIRLVKEEEIYLDSNGMKMDDLYTVHRKGDLIPLNGNLLLTDGDELMVGGYRFRYQKSYINELQIIGIFWLIEPNSKIISNIESSLGSKPYLTLGRNPDNDIQLDSIFISQHHAKISRNREEFILHNYQADPSKRNITLVNFQHKLTGNQSRNVNPGDKIIIGNILLQFSSPYTQYPWESIDSNNKPLEKSTHYPVETLQTFQSNEQVSDLLVMTQSGLKDYRILSSIEIEENIIGQYGYLEPLDSNYLITKNTS